MTTQPEALRLAEKLERYNADRSGYAKHCHVAATELRRLHAVNVDLLAVLKLVESLPGFEPNEHYGVAVKAAIAKAEGGTNEL